MVTFVQATYVQATFVYISNISAVTDPILTKLFWPKFLGSHFIGLSIFFKPKLFLDPKYFSKIFSVQNFFGPKNICGAYIFLDPKFFSDPKFFFQTKTFFLTKHFLKKNCRLKIFQNKNSDPNIFLKNLKPNFFNLDPKFFWGPNFFWQKNLLVDLTYFCTKNLFCPNM